MPRTSKYSDELWAEALKLYEDPDAGPAEASRRTGIPKGTIASRASRGGVATVRKEKTEAAVEAATLSRKQRQERLLDSMLEEAQAALDDHRRPYTAIVHHKDGTSETVELRPDPHGRAKLSTSFGILFDKIQLVTGGATSRNEEIGVDGIAAMLVGAKTAFDIQEEKTAASQ